MINYRFARTREDYEKYVPRNIDHLLYEKWDDSWAESEFYKKLLEEIENATPFAQRIIIRNEDQRMYELNTAGQGVKSLILAYNGHGVFKASSFGENLLPFFSYFKGKHNINLIGDTNLFALWKLLDTEDKFPGMYIENINTWVYTEEEFDEELSKWDATQPVVPRSIHKVLNWNKDLKEPIHLVSENGSFDIELKHKITFIDSSSSMGKTYFLDVLKEEYSVKSEDYLEYVIFPHTVRDVLQAASAKYENTQIILIDIDEIPCTVLDFLEFIDSDDNVCFIIVGHGVSSKIRTPFESIFRIKLSSSRKSFSFKRLHSPKNPVLDKYESLVTEDTGSGYALYLEVLKDRQQGLPAGGFGKVPSAVKLLRKRFESNMLVVLDAATSVWVIDDLCALQEQYKNIDIMCPTSAEHAVAYCAGLAEEFSNELNRLLMLPEKELLKELKPLGKSEVNTETIDLLVASRIFDKVSLRELKGYNLLLDYRSDPTLLRSFIHQEVSRYRADSTQQLPAASDNSDTGTTNHFGG